MHVHNYSILLLLHFLSSSLLSVDDQTTVLTLDTIIMRHNRREHLVSPTPHSLYLLLPPAALGSL